MTDSPPAITSKQDVNLFEQHDGGTLKFIRSIFTYFDSDDTAWVGENTTHGKRDLTVQDLRDGLRKIPDEDAFPKAAAVTIAPDIHPGEHFIKRPQAHCLLDRYTAPLVPQILLEEVDILERLRRNPHPNIVPYYGCIVKRGRITGVVLRHYNMILDHRFLHNAPDFDVDVFEHGLKAALEHIHSMGLAHNDINPSNIALDEQDRPVVIDWGSCKDFDAELLSAGTPGWIEDDFDVSKKDHDISALKKVIEWVKEEKEKASLARRIDTMSYTAGDCKAPGHQQSPAR